MVVIVRREEGVVVVVMIVEGRHMHMRMFMLQMLSGASVAPPLLTILA